MVIQPSCEDKVDEPVNKRPGHAPGSISYFRVLCKLTESIDASPLREFSILNRHFQITS